MHERPDNVREVMRAARGIDASTRPLTVAERIRETIQKLAMVQQRLDAAEARMQPPRPAEKGEPDGTGPSNGLTQDAIKLFTLADDTCARIDKILAEIGV